MPNPKILYLDPTELTYSSSVTNTSYPTTNLNDFEPTTEWKSWASASSVTLMIDLGSVVSCSMVVLDNHNIADFVDAESAFIFGADDINGSNAVSVADNIRVSGSQETVCFQFNPIGRRYWGIEYAGSGGNPIPSASFGNVWFGVPLEFTTPYKWGYKSENTEYKTVEKIALDGTIRTSQVFAGRIVYELQFELQDNDLRTDFQQFHRSVRGKLYPFYLVDTDGTTVRYMHMDDYVPVIVRRYGLNDISSLKLVTHEATH